MSHPICGICDKYEPDFAKNIIENMIVDFPLGEPGGAIYPTLSKLMTVGRLADSGSTPEISNAKQIQEVLSLVFLTLEPFEIKTETFQSFARSSSIHFLLENISEALPCQEGRLKIKKLKFKKKKDA